MTHVLTPCRYRRQGVQHVPAMRYIILIVLAHRPAG